MVRVLALAFALSAGNVAGCALLQPNVDCSLGADCNEVLEATDEVAPITGARVVVLLGRGRGFHAEAHVCYPDGRYVLVDVIGEEFAASIRPIGWDEPPCR